MMLNLVENGSLDLYFLYHKKKKNKELLKHYNQFKSKCPDFIISKLSILTQYKLNYLIYSLKNKHLINLQHYELIKLL